MACPILGHPTCVAKYTFLPIQKPATKCREQLRWAGRVGFCKNQESEYRTQPVGLVPVKGPTLHVLTVATHFPKIHLFWISGASLLVKLVGNLHVLGGRFSGEERSTVFPIASDCLVCHNASGERGLRQ